MDPTKIGPLQDGTGATSIGRIGFAFCLVLAGLAVLVQVFSPFLGVTSDNTTLIAILLGTAFAGKVGQSFAEGQSAK